MTVGYLDTAEKWGWRAVMPALIAGGNAAGILLFTLFITRILNAVMGHRGQPWDWRTGGFWWMGYFGLQVLGALWSDDLAAWSLSLEVKSALWFFPLVMAIPSRHVAKDFWWSVGWSMVVYLAWRLGRAGWQTAFIGGVDAWHYDGFSGDVHPTYLALHATVALLGLGQSWGAGLRRPSVWMLGLLLAVSIGLSGSKAGILAAAMVVMLRMLLYLPIVGQSGLFPGGREDILRWGTLLVVLLMTGVGVSQSRFAEMGTAAAVVMQEAAPVKSSSAGRIVVWRTSAEILWAHPFGVGTGDVVPELVQRYERDGHTYAADRQLNPHNQWLQAGVAFGWPGVLVVSMAFLSIALAAWRHRQGLLLLCTFLIMAHAGVESVLEVQRGVVFALWMLMALSPSRRG